jgi:hypothetical protein
MNWDTEDIVLRFRSAGAGPPTQVRVRRLLKAALRAYQLRCVSIERYVAPNAVAEAIGSVVERVIRTRLQIGNSRDGPFERQVSNLLRDCDGLEHRAQVLLQSIVEHSELAVG